MVDLKNVFVEKLGIQPASILVVDFMHEIELGITKFLFSFLIALLEAVGGQSLIDLVDARYALHDCRTVRLH